MGTDLTLEFFDDAAAYLAVAGDHLSAEPVLGTVVAGVSERWAAGRERRTPGQPTWWFVARDAAGEIVGTGMRTAPFEPYPMFVLPMPEEAAVALARAVHARGEHPGGVNGALPAALVLAEETARLHGQQAIVDQHTRLFECREVLDPPAVDGTLRLARPDEAALCLDWFRRFGAEADEQSGRDDRAAGNTEHFALEDIHERIDRDAIWLLERPGGEVAHLSARSHPAYGVVRIGPVYTPKEHRGRGYAAYVVAALTRESLADGLRVCLFTDQANPVSNKVYERIGFRTVTDMANVLVR